MITDITPASEMRELSTRSNLQKDMEKHSLDESLVQAEISVIMQLIREAASDGKFTINSLIGEDDILPERTFHYASFVQLYLENTGGYKVSKRRIHDGSIMELNISWL